MGAVEEAEEAEEKSSLDPCRSGSQADGEAPSRDVASLLPQCVSLVCQPGSAVAFLSQSLEHRVTHVIDGERRSLLLLCGLPRSKRRAKSSVFTATTAEDRVWWKG